MVNQSFNTDFHFYQSANADVEKIRENFLVRVHEYEVIMNDIRTNPMKGSVQHYLLLGRRGSGKSTLLKRLEIEIGADAELSKVFVAVNLAEEQANIYKLFDLLEEIIAELEHQDLPVEQPEWKEDASFYSRDQFAAIHGSLEKSGKKLVLLLDNIDRIFENLHDDAALLREYLLNYDDIKIIGGSTRMTEHFWKYNKPFYEFFRVLELKPLTSDEIRRLLLNWSEKMNLPELREFVENKPGQLEMVRILTDGLPRTLLFFVNILINRTQETGYEYLRLIMDSVTPLYQERLNNLPPSQRKIVLQMAFLWEGVGAKAIAESTRMDTKLVSAQLKQLIEKGIAEKIGTSTKNNLYRLAERFFNLWLIFTQGSPAEKRRARCLTIFLENFYDGEELVNLAVQHLNNLEQGTLAPNKAALLTKALAQSRFIRTTLRDALIDKTMGIENITVDLKTQLPLTAAKTLEEIKNLVEKSEYKKAFRYAESIEQEDGFREFLIGFVYDCSGDFSLSETHYLRSIEKGMRYTSSLLGLLYSRQKNFSHAIKYLEMAKEINVTGCNYLIGTCYFAMNNLELAEKYFNEAVVENPLESSKISRTFIENMNFELGIKYLKIAVNNKVPHSATTYALLNYLLNGEKQLSIDLLKEEENLRQSNYPELLCTKIFIDLWCGHFEDLQLKLTEFFKLENPAYTKIVIVNLLIHFQYSLAYKLFTNSEFANSLQENFAPLYYVVSFLAKKDDDIELKIPPEIKETFDKLIEEVNLFRNIYYPITASIND